MITIVIPVIDELDTTYHAVHKLYVNTYNVPEIIIVDNASEIPYKPYLQEIVIRNNKNVGLMESLKQGLKQATNEIVLFMHNDVLIHEKAWDIRTVDFFQKVPDLAMAGFFGARGVHPDGARECSESQMVGLEWGDSWKNHSNFMSGYAPASTFDGMALLFRKSLIAIYELSNLPPHHWYDRIIPLRCIDKGYKCATIGIAFDHGPAEGSRKVSAGDGYTQFAKEYCEQHNIEIQEGMSYDYGIYLEGANQFLKEWAPRLPLRVDKEWKYTWNSQTPII